MDVHSSIARDSVIYLIFGITLSCAIQLRYQLKETTMLKPIYSYMIFMIQRNFQPILIFKTVQEDAVLDSAVKLIHGFDPWKEKAFSPFADFSLPTVHHSQYSGSYLSTPEATGGAFRVLVKSLHRYLGTRELTKIVLDSL